jgi:hypothetical protein
MALYLIEAVLQNCKKPPGNDKPVNAKYAFVSFSNNGTPKVPSGKGTGLSILDVAHVWT